MGSIPGLLHNLCQEISSSENSNERWYAYSSHYVARPPAMERRSASASGSATPSPHKQRKRSPPRLHNWTVRLCQIVASDSQKGLNSGTDAGSNEESETESEDDESMGNSSVVTAWYSAQFNASKASVLTKESGEQSWHTLELSIRVAWDKGSMDVMADVEERAKDGTYPSIKVRVKIVRYRGNFETAE
jgi:hypothetical protein